MMLRLSPILFMLFMSGCGGCHEDKPLQKVELTPEAKKIEVQFRRFDRDLFNSDFSQPQTASQQLYQKYGNFFCRFVENDLLLAACNSDSVGTLLKPFVTNRDIRSTHDEIENVFTQEKMSELDETFNDCFQKWNHYFPDSIVPTVIYYQSAWNNNIYPADSTLAISLDCYLGADHPVTRKLSNEAFPMYKKNNMEEHLLVPDAMKGWIAYKFRRAYYKKDLLSELIFYGKLMYIAEALAPEIEDSCMMSWSSKQIEWAKSHEWNTWKTLANEKVMYSTNGFEINKWFADGPFTGANGVPQDSPPQLGVWIGWNVVRQYMAAHPELQPRDIINDKDYVKILSAYKPER